MKLYGDAVFLNAESKQGYSDPNKTYYRALFMSGTNTLEVGVEPKLFLGELAGVTQYTACSCEFEYNTKFRSLTLTAITPK